jgi:hypothetical protein
VQFRLREQVQVQGVGKVTHICDTDKKLTRGETPPTCRDSSSLKAGNSSFIWTESFHLHATIHTGSPVALAAVGSVYEAMGIVGPAVDDP